MAELVKAQDGESSNTTMLKAGNRRIQAGGILTMSLTTILPDLTHALKRVLSAVSRYFVLDRGELFCCKVAMIAAYYDPDTNREMTRVGVDSRTVRRRDMQDVEAITWVDRFT